MKKSSGTIGIDPATFRFVAQCLNHCATETTSRWKPEIARTTNIIIYLLTSDEACNAIGSPDVSRITAI
jgi:hypothetical protein